MKNKIYLLMMLLYSTSLNTWADNSLRDCVQGIWEYTWDKGSSYLIFKGDLCLDIYVSESEPHPNVINYTYGFVKKTDNDWKPIKENPFENSEGNLAIDYTYGFHMWETSKDSYKQMYTDDDYLEGLTGWNVYGCTDCNSDFLILSDCTPRNSNGYKRIYQLPAFLEKYLESAHIGEYNYYLASLRKKIKNRSRVFDESGNATKKELFDGDEIIIKGEKNGFVSFIFEKDGMKIEGYVKKKDVDFK